MPENNPCPDCGHSKAHHTQLVGCLHDGNDICECARSFKEDKSREEMTTERDQAMADAHQGTDPSWEAEAVKAVKHLAWLDRNFTPDDVWVLLEERQVEPPREPRALGPILKRMAKAGRIKAVGFTESRRRHGAPVRVYQAGPNQ